MSKGKCTIYKPTGHATMHQLISDPVKTHPIWGVKKRPHSSEADRMILEKSIDFDSEISGILAPPFGQSF